MDCSSTCAMKMFSGQCGDTHIRGQKVDINALLECPSYFHQTLGLKTEHLRIGLPTHNLQLSLYANYKCSLRPIY